MLPPTLPTREQNAPNLDPIDHPPARARAALTGRTPGPAGPGDHAPGRAGPASHAPRADRALVRASCAPGRAGPASHSPRADRALVRASRAGPASHAPRAGRVPGHIDHTDHADPSPDRADPHLSSIFNISCALTANKKKQK